MFDTMLKKTGLVILFDAMLLAELTWSVYLCRLEPESISWTFAKAFVPLALTTFIGFRILMMRWFGQEEEQSPSFENRESEVRL